MARDYVDIINEHPGSCGYRERSLRERFAESKAQRTDRVNRRFGTTAIENSGAEIGCPRNGQMLDEAPAQRRAACAKLRKNGVNSVGRRPGHQTDNV